MSSTFVSLEAILANHGLRGKMDHKSDARIFLGYSTNNRAYKVYNKRAKAIRESINVVVDNTPKDKEEKEDDVPPQ